MRSIGTLRAACTCALLTLSVPAAGQNLDEKWEVGVGGGASFYLNKSVTSGSTSGNTGFQPGFVVAAWIGQNPSPYIGGEIRYSFLMNNLKVTSASSKATMTGIAHSMEYDVLIHLAPSGSKTRPYVLAGGGIKGYRGAGDENAFQDLMQFAVLTRTSQWKPFGAFGAGIKHQTGPRTFIRVEFRDQISPFPREVILPSPLSGGISGLLHNFQGTVGLGYTF